MWFFKLFFKGFRALGMLGFYDLSVLVVLGFRGLEVLGYRV